MNDNEIPAVPPSWEVVPGTGCMQTKLSTVAQHDRKDSKALAAYEVVSELASLIPDDVDPAMARAVLLSAFLPIREAARLCDMPFPTLQHWIDKNRQMCDQIRSLRRLIINHQAGAVTLMGVQSLKAVMSSLPQTREAWKAGVPDEWDRVKAAGYLAQTMKLLLDLCPETPDAKPEKGKMEWGALNDLVAKQSKALGTRSVTVKETIRMEQGGKA